MKILITGTSKGIGKAVAEKFLKEGYVVFGVDRLQGTIQHGNYIHINCDIHTNFDKLPEIENVSILINNAGVQNEGNDIDMNLKTAIKMTERYAMNNENIKSVVFMASASAHTGAEFPEYVASKGGMVAYMRNVALRLAPHAIANSISPGGVLTDLNNQVIQDEDKWKTIMDMTPLKKWATPEEIAEWTYFIAVVNKSMTGQDILIDNGEANRSVFVW